MKDIFENGGFETSQEQYTKGKELGFAYAKTAPYPEIKAYEEYIEGWDSKDSAQVKQFHDDLNIMSLLERKGVWKLEESRASSEKWPKNAIPLTHSFDYGFMEGIMDFLKQECTNVEVDKLILERDKKMALVRDEGKKHRIFLFYTEEIDSKIKGKQIYGKQRLFFEEPICWRSNNLGKKHDVQKGDDGRDFAFFWAEKAAI